MPGFSETGISQISSVIRLTVMPVLSFMSEMVCLVCLVYLIYDEFLSTQHSTLFSYVEHHAYHPTICRLLKLVKMLRNPLHIGMELLCLLIDRRTDQTRAQ